LRIARFNTGTILSSWTNLAMAGTLRTLGHQVLEGVIPTNDHGAVMHQLGPHHYRRVLATMPTLEQLQDCDVILVSGPDYVSAWLHGLYGKQEWCQLKARKVAFYLESSEREDFQSRYALFSDWYDVHFFPDPEDAERFGGHHILACVDTEMFRPCALHPHSECLPECQVLRLRDKKYDAAFVGSLYPKRVQYLARLLPLIPDVDFRAGGVSVRDLGGECQREWAELMVANLRQIRVHAGLPSNNATMMTMRPFETMACGTFLLTCRTSDNLFRDGEHCCMYDDAKPEELAELIRYYLAHEDERETIAAAGLAEVRRNYSLSQRMQEVLAIVCGENDAGLLVGGEAVYPA
jgi:glycosyltransferase involved in cell wall biosynthesis